MADPFKYRRLVLLTCLASPRWHPWPDGTYERAAARQLIADGILLVDKQKRIRVALPLWAFASLQMTMAVDSRDKAALVKNGIGEKPSEK